ncbi:general secretion pathway protein GspN, partial [Rhodanobacter lindaniclasticus]
MNAAQQRRLTPVLAGVVVLLGILLLVLLGGVGRGTRWAPPRTLPALPSADRADLPQATPLQQFSVVWDKPLFNPDRKPVAHASEGGSNLGDLELTGIIITPSLRMALLH